jgi:hypothetical protein
MKSYPSIDHKHNTEVEIIAFDKLDGSNIRAEWSPKRGFYKYGTRRRVIDASDTHLGKAVDLINEIYAPVLPKIFMRQRWHQNVVCFFEFFGEHSFAGQHRRRDDHKIVLFDVSVYKQGFVPPSEFVKLFQDVGIPKVLYRGRATEDFIQAVRESALDGMSLEGVVCKAPNPKKKKTGKPVMFKIKSEAWLEKLKEHCEGNDGMFEKLK